MLVVFQDPFLLLELHASEGIVRYARTSVPFPGMHELTTTHEGALATMAAVDPRRLGILLDLRDGPARNDPEFEEALGRFTTQLIAGFARKAVLVRSAAGRLQVTRVARENRDVVQVFIDEGQAYAFARGAP